ncbi:type II toxin-antitoxin system HigB family toxin [Leptospira levettii]|uniref:type II toxin-antitoxin system HigB family toxin n=1 Tax=Leptospira levettii TaxID=2023178 RepID=UPI0010833085|nr:type II toxin-antitoxin system HigB family toxin [Leptospira levettii]TGM31419.1 type II toxin-antitoxin system HigB family toxin [Leptospira levettii]
MRIISIKVLREFWQKHNQAEQPLKSWWAEAKSANWKTFHDIKKSYNSADNVGNDRVVFNIKGNSFRLIVKFEYKLKIGFIRFIGTHDEYTKIKAGEI